MTGARAPCGSAGRACITYAPEFPEVIGEAYLILTTHVPVARGKLKVTLMCVKQGTDWKAKDLRAWIE